MEKHTHAETIVDYIVPSEISVLPIFFVPKGEKKPEDGDFTKLKSHLILSQNRYEQLLSGNTFKITEKVPRQFCSTFQLSNYLDLEGDSRYGQIAGELLSYLRFNRYNCPYVLLTVIQCTNRGLLPGYGRPFNGGFNTGGGICIIPSYMLTEEKNFQSTLQHELGHAFGLRHVDVYKYDMDSNDSIMSMNRAHWTTNFHPSKTPGIFIKEDLECLQLNQRVFPGFKYGLRNFKEILTDFACDNRVFKPFEIINQPDPVVISTNSGENCYSKVSNIIQHIIYPSNNIGDYTKSYNYENMWHSDSTTTGWVSVELTFPQEIVLTGIGVHSQHSCEYHAAESIRINAMVNGTNFSIVGDFSLERVDQKVVFNDTVSKTWKFDFQVKDSDKVVIRGLQFFSGDNEIYCPLIPWYF